MVEYLCDVTGPGENKLKSRHKSFAEFSRVWLDTLQFLLTSPEQVEAEDKLQD